MIFVLQECICIHLSHVFYDYIITFVENQLLVDIFFWKSVGFPHLVVPLFCGNIRWSATTADGGGGGRGVQGL